MYHITIFQNKLLSVCLSVSCLRKTVIYDAVAVAVAVAVAETTNGRIQLIFCAQGSP